MEPFCVLLEQLGMTSGWAVKDFFAVCAWEFADFYEEYFVLVLVRDNMGGVFFFLQIVVL